MGREMKTVRTRYQLFWEGVEEQRIKVEYMWEQAREEFMFVTELMFKMEINRYRRLKLGTAVLLL